MLEIKDLTVKVENKKVLDKFNLDVEKGSIHVIMGPNGVGKSTLTKAIMNEPNYKVISGDILFNDKSILKLSTDERAKKGIFLAMQYPMEIEGVSNQDFLGLVMGYNEEEKIATIEVRNYFESGQVVQFFGPNHETFDYLINTIYDNEGNIIEVCRHPKSIIKMKVNDKLQVNDMMRLKVFDKLDVL